MIINASQRGHAGELAHHLTKTIDDDGSAQEVQITGTRNLIVNDNVHEALDDMAMMAWASPKTQNHLFHATLNPAVDMSADEWTAAWELYEREYGLQNLAYLEVTHIKKGRKHIHRVYERVQKNGKALKLSHTHRRNEKIARILEYEFGHPLTIGKHNRAVLNWLEREGRDDVITWMHAGHAHDAERPTAQMQYQDYQQQRRTKIEKAEVIAAVIEAYQTTDTGRGFEQALLEHNLILAKGYKGKDRKQKNINFVIVDAAGGTHSARGILNKAVGVKIKDLRQRWADVAQTLPSVEQTRLERTGKIEIDKSNPDEALRQLEEAKAQIDSEIAQLEAQLAARIPQPFPTEQGNTSTPFQDVALTIAYEAQSTKARTGKQPNRLEQTEENTQPQPQQIDRRRLLEELNHWQQSADRESVKPQALAADWNEAKAWGISQNTLAVMQTHRGSQAIEERERRIDTALNAKPDPKKPVLSAYLTGLKERLQEKGRRYYRSADRWLTERLAKLGYSRNAAKRVLATASPELMDKQPAQRVSYIRSLVERVYQTWEHKQNHKQVNDKAKSKTANASGRSDMKKSEQQSQSEQPAKDLNSKSSPAKSNVRPRKRKR